MPGKNLAGNGSQKYHKHAIIGLGTFTGPPLYVAHIVLNTKHVCRQ
jgi:hypothetical protein